MFGTLLYNILLKFYHLAITIAALFNSKAKLWIQGRKDLFKQIKHKLKDDNSKRAWFHCASLGEFEQARPVIEKFKENYPDYKIILTFFSPSGYESKKNCKLASWVFYLPLDSRKNAKKLIKLFSPKIAFFSKYEFWYYILKELNNNQIPTILFSAIFRDNQFFFSKFGNWYRKLLHYFTHIFVQDINSKNLLLKYDIKNVTVTGDTRFDRVYEIAQMPVSLPCIEKFVQGQEKVIVAGSTYQEDAKILSDFIDSHPGVKLIIAPHEIDDKSIENTVTAFYSNYIKYSHLNEDDCQVNKKQVLIIDTIGLLSKIYRYGTITYVGGGFNNGIHNVLEAVVYGKPVIFGPKYHKFIEAIELLENEIGFSVVDTASFFDVAEFLLNDTEKLEEIRHKAKAYIEERIGSSKKVINWIKENNLI